VSCWGSYPCTLLSEFLKGAQPCALSTAPHPPLIAASMLAATVFTNHYECSWSMSGWPHWMLLENMIR
jgi:hypothetical protein